MRQALFPIAFLVTVHVSEAGNSLLAIHPKGNRLLCANPDNGSVTLVDLGTRKAVREISVGRQPESVAWIGDGTHAMATAYADAQVVMFDTESGQVTRRITVDAEPYGIVVNRAGTTAFVTNEYPGLVTEIDVAKGMVTRTIPVGPFVRGLTWTADESRLLVTHFYSGAVTALDVATGSKAVFWPPQSPKDNLARQIVVHPTRPLAYMPHLRSRTERAHGLGSIFPYLAVLDLVPPEPDNKHRRTIAMDQFNDSRVTANPWEVALSPDGSRMYIVYAGTNDMNVAKVVDDGDVYIEREGRLVEVGSNPRAVAVSPDGSHVFVYNALDFSVAVFEARSMRKITNITVCQPPYSKEILRGKKLFNLARSPMSQVRWISCSSCHPDGDHDGRVWQQPEGIRRTTHFFGMSKTYPLHWSADRDELQDFEHTIRGPLMQGYGLLEGKLSPPLGEPLAGRSKDLDALAEYCNSLSAPISPHALGGKLSEAALRGKEVFFSKETQCATCHPAPTFTDRKKHDVGTGKQDRTEKMGFEYDTPSLVRTYRNLSWLHDGSAVTLREVITKNSGDLHGKTSHLKPNQVDDLVEFLKSLPYDTSGP
jgi:YVTN family beta-propeller protein